MKIEKSVELQIFPSFVHLLSQTIENDVIELLLVFLETSQCVSLVESVKENTQYIVSHLF